QSHHDWYADDCSRLGARHDVEYVTNQLYQKTNDRERVAPATLPPEANPGNAARTRHGGEEQGGPAMHARQALMATRIQLPHRFEWTTGECQRNSRYAGQGRANEGEDAERGNTKWAPHRKDAARISRSAER